MEDMCSALGFSLPLRSATLIIHQKRGSKSARSNSFSLNSIRVSPLIHYLITNKSEEGESKGTGIWKSSESSQEPAGTRLARWMEAWKQLRQLRTHLMRALIIAPPAIRPQTHIQYNGTSNTPRHVSCESLSFDRQLLGRASTRRIMDRRWQRLRSQGHSQVRCRASASVLQTCKFPIICTAIEYLWIPEGYCYARRRAKGCCIST